MSIQPGSKIGRYQIKAIIGKGGMAVVYRAFDTRLKRDVAIKFIRMEQFGSNQWVHIRKRFEREAIVMAKLDHPHIIKVFDYGEFEGTPYLVMQLVEGGSLKQRIGKPIPWQDAVQQIKPIAEALEYAHSQGVVHRDVKPGNILLTKSSSPLLADFGIAKIVESTSGDSLTSSGVGMGTPEYMAPEQAMGKKIDQRTDIYSLGVILYEMITGTRPFKADTPMEVVFKQTTEQLPKASQIVRNLPGSVDDFLQKTLAKNPTDRHVDMAAFRHELAALASGKTPSPRRAATPARPVATTRRERTVIDQPLQAAKKPSVPVWAWGVAGLLILVVVFSLFSNKGGTPVSKVEIPAVNQSITTTQFPTTVPTQYPTSTPKPVLGIGSSKVSKKDGMTMMYVPAGEFIMGSDKGDGDEKPVHKVHLDDFWLDKTEVSNAHYRLCVQEGFCEKPSGNYYDAGRFSDNPVVNVSWNDAKAYCAWAGRRLPSEAEWEKAARGPDGRTYPWGEVLHHSKANYNYLNGAIYPAYSKEEGIGFYGVLNLSGNVWEWVADWYGESYYIQSPSRNPKGPETGNFRVYRGGSWVSDQMDVRSSNRARNYPTYRSDSVGFRCAMDAAE